MKILSLEEYKRESDAWCDKYSEYMNKLVDINIREDAIPKESYSRQDEERFEKERMDLYKQYEGYTSTFNVNFGCYLTEDNIDELMGPRLTNSIWKEDIQKIGHRVKVNDGDYYGLLTGVVNSVCDIYYEIRTSGGKVIYETAVSRIETID